MEIQSSTKTPTRNTGRNTAARIIAYAGIAKESDFGGNIPPAIHSNDGTPSDLWRRQVCDWVFEMTNNNKAVLPSLPLKSLVHSTVTGWSDKRPIGTIWQMQTSTVRKSIQDKLFRKADDPFESFPEKNPSEMWARKEYGLVPKYDLLESMEAVSRHIFCFEFEGCMRSYYQANQPPIIVQVAEWEKDISSLFHDMILGKKLKEYRIPVERRKRKITLEEVSESQLADPQTKVKQKKKGRKEPPPKEANTKVAKAKDSKKPTATKSNQSRKNPPKDKNQRSNKRPKT